jgi:hypothetical protein
LPNLRSFNSYLRTDVVALLATQSLARFLSVGAPANVLRNVLQTRNYEAITAIAHDVDGAPAFREKCQRPTGGGCFAGMTPSLAMQALVELQLRARSRETALCGSQLRDQDLDRLQRFLRCQSLQGQFFRSPDALVDLVGKKVATVSSLSIVSAMS